MLQISLTIKDTELEKNINEAAQKTKKNINDIILEALYLFQVQNKKIDLKYTVRDPEKFAKTIEYENLDDENLDGVHPFSHVTDVKAYAKKLREESWK